MENSNRDLEAIETQYNGYRFRSRLEARWAVFFDSLNIDWRFEHQGFELQNGEWYLPDFYLPNIGLRSTETKPLWVEIKPKESKAELETAEAFVKTVNEDMAILVGRVGEGFGFNNFQMGSPNGYSVGWDNFMHFMKCTDCGSIKYEFEEGNYMSCETCGGHCTYKHTDFIDATEEARSARFEHGEKPDP